MDKPGQLHLRNWRRGSILDASISLCQERPYMHKPIQSEEIASSLDNSTPFPPCQRSMVREIVREIDISKLLIYFLQKEVPIHPLPLVDEAAFSIGVPPLTFTARRVYSDWELRVRKSPLLQWDPGQMIL